MWVNATPAEFEVIKELEESRSDRATAIVASAILEERLSSAITSRLQKDEKALSRLFKYSGPLGTFSSKIDLGYLMGLYGKEIYCDLNTIREIRNEFAHSLRTSGFKSQRVNDLCKNLKAFERNFLIRWRVRGRIKKQKMFTELDPKSPSINREKFVRTCQVLVALIVFSIRARRPRTPSI
jgi:DNA-binding MltR family transcriptional regulator